MPEGNLKYDINRSGVSIVSFQLVGICHALEIVVQTGTIPQQSTVALLKNIEEGVRRIITGPCMEGWPSMPEAPNAADLLVRAYVLKTTVAAFLSPEESSDEQAAFGFAAANDRGK